MDPTPLSLAEAMQIEPVAAVVRDFERSDLFFYRFASTRELFGAERAAESWLRECGFGVGEVQPDAPRPLLLGAIDPPPWTWFGPAPRTKLDGALVVDERDAIVIVVRDALRAAAQAVSG